MFLLETVIFSKDECSSLINSVSNFTESKLYYKGDGGDMKPAIITSQRKSLSAELSIIKGTSVYNTIDTSLQKLGYKLNSQSLNCSIVKYGEGDFIHHHKDGAAIFMSFVVQLSESTEYTGGEFLYWNKDVQHELKKEIGCGVILGPDIEHEVKVITKGIRYSFVLFLEYDNVLKISKQSFI